ncbi:hypothetical protein BGLT_00129 [Caballeronia glathei]|jgi:hypothetical protein|uniref:Uncharacterized protein n=1 Tax=Caballeronia glathei TaxID=60547 RepID=A0A069PVW2_9BURK|nr:MULTISPECIES: hypothetical protein [Burkholderiaceae]KDR44562.1 hypothetical protein BG61_12775 [Caballeronia glathei]TCK44324.1 hypothetical protein B0G84_2686 [Paraburkholderia sp. BL8N3]CDY73953.1 hypothetical protein BGLT_00129 [Caballeronia glathei]
MARPRIGIFGALFAVGSVLAWKWVQSQDASKRRAARDLNRWEDEGGKVATPASASSIAPADAAHANGSGVIGGTPEAWHFPRS